MNWLYKLSHLVWPENTTRSTAQEPRTRELSRGRRRRRHAANGVEDIPAPLQMSGVSNRLSPTNGQMSNSFQFSQLGKDASGIRPNTSLHRDNSNHTTSFTLKKGGTKTTPQNEEELQEERRLFGGSRRDPNAVRITPGALARKGRAGKDLKSFENFTPRNTLHSTFRGKPLDTFAGRHLDRTTHSGSHVQGASGVVQELEGNRPRKRRRTDEIQAPAEVIEVNDDDSIIHTESPSSTRPRTYSLSYLSQSSPIINHHGSANQKESITHEFWNVESRMQDFKNKKPRVPDLTEDELFTMEAKAQRLGNNIGTNISQSGGSSLSRPSEPMVAIEVSPIGNLGGAEGTEEETQGSAGSLADSTVQTDSQLHDSYTRESPDALQGDKTVPESWRSGVKDRLGRMPGDISPTNFSIVKKDRKRADRRRRISSNHTHSFPMSMFDHKMETVEKQCTLIVKNGSFLVTSDTGSWVSKEFSIDKINLIWHGGPRVAMKFPMASGSTDDLKLQFSSEKEAVECCNLMGELNNTLKLRDKGSEWMENMFKRSLKKRQGNRQPASSKRESLQDDHIDAVAQPSTQPKRQKLSESLLDSDGTTRKSPLEDSLHSRGPRKHAQDDMSPLSHSHPDVDRPITIPVKKYSPTVSLRVTRSQGQRKPTTINSDHEPSPSPHRYTRMWSRPLVYPPKGKRKAEVEFHDLERLGDGEFLNDNLIGLYLRFLEHHMEIKRPDLATRVYFFNSYFFASLTNTPKGLRGINYQAVEKWTRNVDLFSYDYIVVPINENKHWYMAIICNLRALRPTGSIAERNEPESDKVTHDSPCSQASADLGNPDNRQSDKAGLQPGENNNTVAQTLEHGSEQLLQEDFDSMSLSDNGPEVNSKQNDTSPLKEFETQDRNEWPDEGENGPLVSIVQTEEESDVAQQPKSLRSGKLRSLEPRAKISPRKLPCDPKEPVIITFDSLGCARYPTIRILRQYIEEEGKAKRSLSVDTKKIRGIVARNIPYQPNFSDCGLYLLAYLEKFMWDPDVFISRLVRKEMSEYYDWPPMKSHILRRRLRNFLLELHEEEGRSKQNEAGEERKLIDTDPLKILLVDDPPTEAPQGEPSTSNHSLGLKQHSETSPNPRSLENKLLAHDSEKEPRQVTPTRALTRLNQNEQVQTSMDPAIIEHEAIQHSEAKSLLEGILLYGGQDSTNKQNISEIPRTPSPGREVRVSGIPDSSSHPRSPSSHPRILQGQDQEILDGIE
ncbi:Ulp1 protease [Blastomyces dermatitidis ER-3]|uniref:Ulp1 protease n=2 Tax=Ajellomyces dermatitidis TaxID=5039 RepID=F2TFU8_AJEDA|nr:Ulp1 protease [Blastomyces dermatitidis ER-3]EEQ89286.1 Ulp1 protease [Blastomyces dermatitidis ER-3]EGE82111.2 Ulp1 protease [Blastomyces dermatitidis ATCC 18188]